MAKPVITGQQIGLLGGPLYTTYKVLGALAYAHEIGGNAIYWLETNDADFQEINHLDYLDAQGDLRTLTWERDSQGYSCGQIVIDASLTGVLQEFFDTIRQTEFTPILRALALRCYAPGRTLGAASADLATALFGRFDLRIFDPATPDFIAFSQPILLREAEHTPPGAQCHLFCRRGPQRLAVFKTETGYAFRDGSPIALADYDLVPQLKTRNVCQDAYFGTHTYIAGPGEIAYIRELDAQYAFHNVRKAAVRPRMSVTLLEPRAVRLLGKYQIPLLDVLQIEKTLLLKQIVTQHSGFDYDASRQRAHELTQAYLTHLQPLGFDLKKIEKTLHQTIKEALGEQRAQEKATQDAILKAAGSLADLLQPFGRKQERVFNLFYYMNLYGGLAFVDWLYDRYTLTHDTIEIAV